LTEDDTTDVNDVLEDFAAEVPDEIDDETDGSAALTAEDVQDVLLYTLDWSVQSLLDRIGSAFDIIRFSTPRCMGSGSKESIYRISDARPSCSQVVLAEDRSVKGRLLYSMASNA